MKKLWTTLIFLGAFSAFTGCDPLTVHKVTTTVFDGVPSLPPAEQYCQDYHETKLKQDLASANKKQSVEASAAGSKHLPYAEKKCANCHDKSKDSGLLQPKQELCFLCHPTIISKRMMHGPAAVGSCLECHEPHSSNNPSLLKVDAKKVCAVCHQEKRLAEEMHDKVSRAGMLCTDCHDPHAGDAPYFLR